ncbi:MAG: 3-dehydroquinate dehydratase [Campylobacterota bacterium]|nr:3-dehydroquinate dehydratase [Campylobacterota bacterium]
MKFFNRGLYALILTLIFQSQLVAEYLYKDEIVNRLEFSEQVELLGSELYQKTGISLRLVMLKKLPEGRELVEYEKELVGSFSEPTILLIFSEFESAVDIQVNDPSLYNYFDRKQVLSPVSSAVQAFIMAIVYGDTWEHFNDLRTDYGGSIFPLIVGKAKPEQVIGKYAGSMFNGYIDIAHQVSTAKKVVLESDPGDTNQETLFYVKIFFYGFVLYGIVMYIRRVIYRRRHKNEK